MNKIFTGHALDVLKTFPDESINMCVTSPPYWGLRDYNTQPAQWNDGWQGELGAEPDFNQYINHLCDIFDEVKRVLRTDGTCWVNIGDTYGGCSLNSSYGVKVKGQTSFLKQVDHLQKVAHTRGKYSKSLLLIPFKFAIEIQNRGSAGIVDQIKTITTSLCGALGLIAVMLYSSWKLAFIGVLVLCIAFIPVILISLWWRFTRRLLNYLMLKSLRKCQNILTQFTLAMEY